jgi:hypothetical protein
MKYVLLLSLIFLAACAQVGPVEITDADTVYTVLTAFGLAVIVFITKGYIEYHFAKRLERYKKRLDEE